MGMGMKAEIGISPAMKRVSSDDSGPEEAVVDSGLPEEPVKRGVGRPSKAQPFRGFVVDLLLNMVDHLRNLV